MERKEKLKKLLVLLCLFIGIFIASVLARNKLLFQKEVVPYPSQVERIQNAVREEPKGAEPVSPTISVRMPTLSPQLYQRGDWGDNIP